MGLFTGIKDAKYSEGGIYFLPGNYLVRVDKAKVGKTRKDVPFFVTETTILESDNPERKRGSSCSWMCMGDKDAFLGNVKNFCAIATEIDDADVDEAGVELIVSEDNPLGGTILRVQATNIKTREGKDFTKVIWKMSTPEERAPYEKAA